MSWSRLDALLDDALARPRQDRGRFLDEACRGDPPLRTRLGELLEIAEAEDRALRPGGGLEGVLADEVLEDLAGQSAEVPLAPGTRLGRFEVRGLLGRGGVGSVYRAHDPVLGREVAIKALAEAFRADAAALRRFEREARMLATVNHPNIATIHGFEIIDGAPYLVLELVEGETLEERLGRGALRWREAAEVARQIAEALQEAHRKGVVHRDLKPANVKLAGPGRVKVLDFGLARALPASSEGTLPDDLPSLAATGAGAILGTAPYMSPEQARGLPVDARSDLWALGCVLYEMLAGRRAFAGPNVADVLAAVVRDEVDWHGLPLDTPPALRRLIERCLRREVRDRLQDAGDARLELADLLGPSPVGPDPPRRIPRRGLVALPWLLAAGALVALGVARSRPQAAAPAARVMHLALPTPPGIELAEDFAAPFALSPDASTLAFLGTDGKGSEQLFVRALDEREARSLPGTEGARQPFFSPDGRWIAFFADGNLYKVSLAGGMPVALAELSGRPRGGWWGADGTIFLSGSETAGLSRVSAEGGRLEELTRPDVARGERSHRWPQVLPGRHALLFTVDYWAGNLDDAVVEAVSLRTGERHVVVRGGGFARFLADGYLIFVKAGRLFAVRFDPDRLEAEGRPTTVLDGVRFGSGIGGRILAPHTAVADDTLVYVPGLPDSGERHLAWIDLAGRTTRFPGPARHFREPRLDPRGERVAVRVGPPGEAEVWIQDVDSGTLSQLTFGLRPWSPIWTRDGRSITVGAGSGDRWRLLSVPVAGGPSVVLLEGQHRLYPGDWSADGRFLVYQELRPGQGWDLAAIEVDTAGLPRGAPQPLAATPAHETGPRLSPDGRWLAYASDELDAVPRVYVVPFQRSGERVHASRPAAGGPVWTGGRELLYWVPFPSQMRHVIWSEQAGAFEVRNDDALWPATIQLGSRMPRAPFDFDPRSKRLLFLDGPAPDPSPPQNTMRFIMGFGEEVKRRLASAP